MTPTTFPCPACGAPNEPETGRARMSCIYCGTNLEIPLDLRKEAKPSKASPRPTRTEATATVDVPEILRQAQPVAAGTLNLLFIWSWVKRIVPACFTFALISFVLCLVLSVLLFVLGGK